MFGLAPGLLGLLAGLLSGALLGRRLLRDQPWDIHDEKSFGEPARTTFGSVAPTLIMFGSLLTMSLGLAAIDRDVNIMYGWVGDGLGALELALTVAYLVVGFA
jgi:hypothetical protein